MWLSRPDTARFAARSLTAWRGSKEFHTRHHRSDRIGSNPHALRNRGTACATLSSMGESHRSRRTHRPSTASSVIKAARERIASTSTFGRPTRAVAVSQSWYGFPAAHLSEARARFQPTVAGGLLRGGGV